MSHRNKEFEPDTKAVTYTRVSSTAQTTRGDGLGSQRQRCLEYARYKGLTVVEDFQDDISGSLATRPGMQAMLAYLRKHRKREKIVVIIDDISRLARGIEAHLKLRAEISAAGGILKSPTIEFGEDSDSILVENLLASVSQHQREKNGEQTVNRMRARTMGGYWPFAKPVGYVFRRVAGHGNMLVRDEPRASILTEALEGFSTGRFATQVEVKRFLDAQPEFPKERKSGEVHPQRVTDILTRPIYAGYVEAPNWGVSRRKGHHEPLISLATFERIQARLSKNAKAPYRKDLNTDFVLRAAVSCAACNGALTACWSRSSTGKLYPYMLCHSAGCPSRRKSIPLERIEREFENLLRTLQPAPGLFALVRAMFENAWDQRTAQAASVAEAHRKEMAGLDAQLDKLMALIVETDSAVVIKAYEHKIAALENRKLVVAEQLAGGAKPRYAFEDMFERAMAFLSSPWRIWVSGDFAMRRLVLRLAFAERIPYRRGEGFSNAKFALPFNILKEMSMHTNEMARPAGFEFLAAPRVVSSGVSPLARSSSDKVMNYVALSSGMYILFHGARFVLCCPCGPHAGVPIGSIAWMFLHPHDITTCLNFRSIV